MQAPRRRAAYADLAAMSEDVRAEIVDGDVVTHPSPLPEHSRAHQGVTRAVGGPFDDDDGRDDPGGWWILQEVDVELGTHVVVRPDIARWRRERLPSPWGIRPLTVVPDWICEVLSPFNQGHDRVKKRRLYAKAGVQFYWIVDPAARTLEALKLVDGVRVDAGSYEDDATARVPRFEAVELEIGRLFPPRAAER